jgi:hypothetical protein
MDDEPGPIILPAEIARFFKNPALLATETFREYDCLFKGTARDIDPQNNLEWLSLRNYLDSQWQIRRVQTAFSSIVNAARRPALRAILESILPETQDRPDIAVRMTQEWLETSEKRARTLELLNKHGLDENSIWVRAMEMHASELERLDAQLQRHKLASVRHLKQLESIRRSGLWRGTEQIGAGVRPRDTGPSSGSRAGGAR